MEVFARLFLILLGIYLILFFGTLWFLPQWGKATRILQKSMKRILTKSEIALAKTGELFKPLKVLSTVKEYSQSYSDVKGFLARLSNILEKEKSNTLALSPNMEIPLTAQLSFKKEVQLRHSEVSKLARNLSSFLRVLAISWLLKICLIVTRYQISRLEVKPIILLEDSKKIKKIINVYIEKIRGQKQSWRHLPKWVKKLRGFQEDLSNLTKHLSSNDFLFTKSIRELHELDGNINTLLSHIQAIETVQPSFDKLQEIRNSSLHKQQIDDLTILFSATAENEMLQFQAKSGDYDIRRLKKRADNLLADHLTKLNELRKKSESRRIDLENIIGEMNKMINLRREYFVVQINDLIEMYPRINYDLSALSDWLATSENLPSIAKDNLELLSVAFEDLKELQSEIRDKIKGVEIEGEGWTNIRLRIQELSGLIPKIEKMTSDFMAIGDLESAFKYTNNTRIALTDAEKQLVLIKRNLGRITETHQSIVESVSKLNDLYLETGSMAYQQIIRRISTQIKAAKEMEEYDFVIYSLDACEKELIDFTSNLLIGEAMKDKGHNTYNVYGNAANVGPGGKNNVFNETINNIDIQLTPLADELKMLLEKIDQMTEKKEHTEPISALVAAEIEARNGNKAETFNHLAKAGNWILGVAKSVGVPIAIKAIEKAMGL